MTFQSYAQNFEDVMLWRALGHIDGGFYIDVGAQDPVLDSVTCAFYERGWRGINIEPVPEYYAALVAARPEDVNLQVVAVDAPGSVTLYSIPDTGLSTLDPTIAAMHAARGWKVQRLIVEQLTLAEICRQHAPSDIHFLKIDVEGVERETLAGADWHAHRPWIVLVEATLPNSPEENWGPWEPILTGAGYRFVWFDGLNRFYVARERASELERHFRVPPNTFDRFQKVSPGLQRELRVCIAKSAALKEKLAKAEAEIGRLTAAAEAAAASHAASEPSAQDAALRRALRPAWQAARAEARPLARRRKAFMSTEAAAGIVALQRSIDEIGRELHNLATTLRDLSSQRGDPVAASRTGQSGLRKLKEPIT